MPHQLALGAVCASLQARRHQGHLETLVSLVAIVVQAAKVVATCASSLAWVPIHQVAKCACKAAAAASRRAAVCNCPVRSPRVGPVAGVVLRPVHRQPQVAPLQSRPARLLVALGVPSALEWVQLARAQVGLSWYLLERPPTLTGMGPAGASP